MSAAGVGSLPKYVSISADLRERIASGEFATGDRLPAQAALAARYGVTVMTLRQALADLEGDGLVHAVKGTGTFVSEPSSVRYDLDHLWNFTEAMTRQGVDVSTDVLAVRVDAAGPDVDAARRELAADDTTSFAQIVRLRRRGDEAIVLQHSVMATENWRAVSSADFANASLYDELAARRGLVLDRATESIRAVALDPTDARLLDVGSGDAAFESVRVSEAADGTPFLYDRALMRGDGTEIRTERSARSSHVAFRTQSGSDPD